MTKAEEILKKYPSVKLGLDEHYGKQTVLNALNEALCIHDVVGRSELLRDYFAWHEEKGYVSHKDSDIDEFLSEQ